MAETIKLSLGDHGDPAVGIHPFYVEWDLGIYELDSPEHREAVRAAAFKFYMEIGGEKPSYSFFSDECFACGAVEVVLKTHICVVDIDDAC